MTNQGRHQALTRLNRIEEKSYTKENVKPMMMTHADLVTLCDALDSVREDDTVDWTRLLLVIREFCSPRCKKTITYFAERYGLTSKEAYLSRKHRTKGTYKKNRKETK